MRRDEKWRDEMRRDEKRRDEKRRDEMRREVERREVKRREERRKRGADENAPPIYRKKRRSGIMLRRMQHQGCVEASL